MTGPGAHSPRLVLGLANFAARDPGDWSDLVDATEQADAAGFDKVVVSDHVVMGNRLEDYGRPELGGVEGGSQPTGADGHWLEPMTTLSYLAARTSRVRLGTNIMLAALRRPVVLAKAAATLDVLSGGRLDLGVGVGWQRAEYEAAGLEFERRGALLDHTLQVCATLWGDAPSSLRSDELTFHDVTCRPAPHQPGGVPVWVSGRLHPAVINRLATFGRGWIPWGPDARDVIASTVRMRRLVAATGRDPTSIGVLTYLPTPSRGAGVDLGETFADVARLVAAGVTDFRVPRASPGGSLDGRFDETVSRFRDAIASG